MIDRRRVLKVMGAAGASAALGGAGRLPGIGEARASGPAQDQDPDRFEIKVSDAEIEDLRRRLSAVRWPPDTPGQPWDYGTDRAYLEELVAYWRDEYDWRRHEAGLNRFNRFTTTVAGRVIHFVHEKGRGPAPLPLLVTHGWPGTSWEMLPIVPGLSNPTAHGGDAADAFDVVAPDIPGFGFSGEQAEGTDMARTAELWVALMDRLGYQRFGAYGSDIGAGVTRHLSARVPDRLIGVYTAGSPGRLQREPETAAERDYLAQAEAWRTRETGYQSIQGTKPQILAYGLTDSPVGLAAWLTEKLRAWSDSNGDVESRFTKDQMLTLISIYWFTKTIGTSVRHYRSIRLSSGGFGAVPAQVPQGYAEFVQDPWRGNMPRSYAAEPAENVTRWSVFDSGGHFPAIEEPDLIVQELREFFRPLR